MVDPRVANRGDAHLAVVVALAALSGADSLLAGSGGARMAAASLNLGGVSSAAYDVAVLAGTGPFR